MRIILSLCLFLTILGFISPPYGNAKDDKPLLAEPSKESVANEFLIGPDDVLDISVWKSAELSKTVIVRPDGMISLPLIGDVLAAGQTPNQLREAIIKQLKNYQQTAVASVIVHEVNSYKIYLVGEVIKPGIYLLKRKTTLLQAIALGGGFTQFAQKNKMVVIREKPYTATDSCSIIRADMEVIIREKTNTITETPTEEKISVRFDDIINMDKTNDKNIVLRPGDTIVVP